MLGNSLEFVVVWFAVSRLGAVLVPVNTALKGDFLSHIAVDSGARIAVVGAAYLSAFSAIEEQVTGLERLIVVGDGHADAAGFRRIRTRAYAELETGSETWSDASLRVSDLAAIMYTSGTTGKSKGVLLPYGHLHLNPHVYIEQLGLTPEEVIYTCLPLFHANGLLLGIYTALILGCRVVVAPSFSASRWASDIRMSGATVTNLLGVMTDFILKQPPQPTDRLETLRDVLAAPFSPAQAEALEARFGVRVGSLYGSTELNCPIYRPPGLAAAGSSCGRLVERWFEARLVDPDTDLEVPASDAGELVVRPRAPWTTMAGYHGRPEETVAAWRNLWFHTGDLMRRDADGNYFYLDRLKDSIRRRGENISAVEIESVLANHPAIASVAVIGVPSPFDEHEQEVKACIVLGAGRSADPADIASYCRERMPAFAVPRYIEFYEALPMTATEKVAKAELRSHGIRPATWISPDADGRRGRVA